jgi:nucleoid-associated protein YgaU
MRRDVKIGLTLGLGIAVLAGVVLLGNSDPTEFTDGPTPEAVVQDRADALEEVIDGAAPSESAGLPPLTPTESDLIARGPVAPATTQPNPEPVEVRSAPPGGPTLADGSLEADGVKRSPLDRAPVTVVPDIVLAPSPTEKASPSSSEPKTERLPLTHTVRRGDNLFALAKHYYGSGDRMMDIAGANPALKRNPNRLMPGMKLVIPKLAKPSADVRYYRVKPSDTLRSIAQRLLGNSVMYIDIYEANAHILKSPDIIPVGKVLRIPEVASKSTKTIVR